MMRALISLLIVLSCHPVYASTMSGGSVSAGAYGGPEPSAPFVLTTGLQTNPTELDRFVALSGSGQYAADRTTLDGASHAGLVWPYNIQAGAWEVHSGRCEPVGLDAVGSEFNVEDAASVVFAKALNGYIESDNAMYAEVRTRLLQFAATTGFTLGAWDGSEQCALDLGEGVPHLIEAALLLEQAGYSSWTYADRLTFATWLAEEVFPAVSFGIDVRKNNWGIVTFGAALAAAAYVDGPITSITLWDASTTTPAAYFSGYSPRLSKWMSGGGGDALDSICATGFSYGFLSTGAFADDLRRPAGTAVADCNAASIGAHTTDGGCSSSTSCNQSGGHFYHQKSLNGLVRVAEIVRRGLGSTGVFDLDTNVGGDVDIIQSAKFATGGDYQTWLVQDTTQGFKFVAGEYYADAGLLAALDSGSAFLLRGGRDYSYTRITHAPGVAYEVASSFVTLADSTTFGPGGTIFDYSTRIVTPLPLPDAPAWNDPIYNPANTLDLSAETCAATAGSGASLNSVLQNSIKTHLSLGGGRKNSVILLPTGCPVRWYVTAANDGTEYTIPNETENVQFYCPPGNSVCGLRQYIRPGQGVFSNGDYLTGTDGQHGTRSFHIGNTRRTGITSCPIIPTNEYGAKAYQLNCSVATSDENEWGPGDIVRIQSDPIPGQGADGYNYLTRVTCVRNNSGGLTPASDPTGTLCGDINANNQIQVENAPPFNLHASANFWGENAETTFTSCLNEASCDGSAFTATYIATPNPRMVQIKRVGSARCDIVASGVCGNGTAATEDANAQIAENVWFVNMNWTTELMIGGNIMRWLNAFGGGVHGGTVRASGRPSLMEWGRIGTEAGSVTLAHTTWDGFWAENAKASGRILQINKTNPVTLHVASEFAQDVWRDNAHRRFYITDGVTEPLFKDAQFLRPSGHTWVDGSPGYYVVTMEGVDGTAGVGGFDIDTDPGTGWAVMFSTWGGATSYANGFASNIQVYNNVWINPSQHFIMQGCTGCVYAANYVRNPPDMGRGGRGPFHHGNASSPGNIYEMNDQDQAIITMDSSNRAPNDNGEGSNLVFYKNRRPEKPPMTWPLGTSVGDNYAGNYTLGPVREYDQRGASNDSWSIFLNTGHGLVVNNPDTANALTNCSNVDEAGCLAPHQTIRLAMHRNKCGSCNLDVLIDTANTTTLTDITSTEDGENHLGLELNWSAEVGSEPTSLFWTAKPEWWCNEAMTFGEMGAYYDDFTGTLGKLPAQIRYEIASGLGGTCTLP